MGKQVNGLKNGEWVKTVNGLKKGKLVNEYEVMSMSIAVFAIIQSVNGYTGKGLNDG